MNIFRNNHFLLRVNNDIDSTDMVMELVGDKVTTVDIKDTLSYLQKNLPSILFSKCYNQKNYPFSKEVEDTEIGHLFEHIILEYLSIIKKASGLPNYIHNGVTSWNWVEERRGVFHISIDAGEKDFVYFMDALEKSLKLTLEILDSKTGFESQVPPSRPEMHLQLQLEADS